MASDGAVVAAAALGGGYLALKSGAIGGDDSGGGGGGAPSVIPVPGAGGTEVPPVLRQDSGTDPALLAALMQQGQQGKGQMAALFQALAEQGQGGGQQAAAVAEDFRAAVQDLTSNLPDNPGDPDSGDSGGGDSGGGDSGGGDSRNVPTVGGFDLQDLAGSNPLGNLFAATGESGKAAGDTVDAAASGVNDAVTGAGSILGDFSNPKDSSGIAGTVYDMGDAANPLEDLQSGGGGSSGSGSGGSSRSSGGSGGDPIIDPTVVDTTIKGFRSSLGAGVPF